MQFYILLLFYLSGKDFSDTIFSVKYKVQDIERYLQLKLSCAHVHKM